jgi:HAD superfamily hydrolase (TIGR01509 family)
VKVLFFDVGYTLVNEDTVWEKRCREQAEMEEAKKLGLTADVIYHEIEIASVSRKPQYRTVVEKYGFKEVAPYRTELEVLYEEAPDVIKALAQKYELGIIANQLDGLKERLEAFGLLQYFKYIVSSWDVQVMKPDVRIFEYALRLSKCDKDPARAWMIGDRLDNDVLPAKKLGMKTVWIKQGFGALQKPESPSEEPDYTISGLGELLKIFKES